MERLAILYQNEVTLVKYYITEGDFFQMKGETQMNLVEVRNNQVVVSSKKVADRFNKLHKDVLENIRNILAAENSATKFFQESTFENRGKQYPEYLMNRDGFTLLAMGFTGKEALQWKLKYIAAFNDMEARLNSKKPRTHLNEALKAKEIEARLNNSRARVASEYRKIADKTDIKEYKHICQQKAAEALAGVPVLPMEQVSEKTYSATEIARMLGTNANKIGKLANAHHLKTAEYGKLFYDKSPNSCKEVETFRYYSTAIEVFRRLLNGQQQSLLLDESTTEGGEA